MNLSTLVTLYHSFIYPYPTYCLEVWGGAGDVYLLSLFNPFTTEARFYVLNASG